MDKRSTSPCETLAEQYQALLEVAEAISVHRDLRELFRDLAQHLPRVVHVNFVGLSIHDPEKNLMRLHTVQANVPADIIGGHEVAIEDSPDGLVWETQQPLLIDDITRESRFPKVMELMRQDGVRSFCSIPLTTAQRRLGTLGLGSLQQGAYDDGDLEFLQQVAKQVAVAVDNVLNYQSVQAFQKDLAHEREQLAYERDRLRLLLDVNNAVVSNLDLRELLMAISACLRQVIPHDFAGLTLYNPALGQLHTHVFDFPQHQDFIEVGIPIPLEGTPSGRAFTSRQTVLVRNFDPTEFPAEVMKLAAREGLKSGCSVPLISHDRVLGTLDVASLREGAFSEQDAELLGQISNQFAIAVENALAYQQIADLKDKLNKEKLYLEEEIRTEYNFEEIIGESLGLKRVLKQVETVGPTDSTVLILGETGTGKELIARALHNLSGRRERTFVKMNCAAIPTGLLESELFGHERGAFTGAIAQKVGRFELAHQGTLFLDEVGDIPMELQSKLLRVLQEQEFERLGSTKTIRVNVRLVAATNQDLTRMIADKQFRSDLYYRLNVFPIVVPPLRDRPEDIPLLVRYFTQKHSRRMNKQVESIPSETMAILSKYYWPGNIRELENLIERAVILSPGSDLQVPAGELKMPTAAPASSAATLEAVEREHILRALREANGVLGGPSGAAVRLGMKRTTLQSKMSKLGIERHS